MNKTKKLLFLFAIFAMSFASIPSAFAQTPAAEVCKGLPANMYPAQMAFTEMNKNSDSTDDPNGHIGRTVDNNLGANTVSFNAFFYGRACTYGATKTVVAMSEQERNNGALTVMGDQLTMAFNNPITLDIPTHYASILLPQEFRAGIDSPAYAANGPGYPSTVSALDHYKTLGIGKLWGISFSIAMIGFVVVLLYAGFMIMFRQKLGGQAVVTVSMSLQNMVIGIFLALSSYALGGFFVNLSKYLVMVLNGMLSDASVFGTLKTAFVYTPFALVGRLGDFLNFGQAPALKIDLLDLSGSLFSSLGSVIVWLIARLMIAFMIFTAGFKIFFSIFTTYARMLLDIIMAPIYFMVASLPGKQDGYMGWVRKMFKNALVMPMTFLLVNLALFIANIKLPAGQSVITAVTGGGMNTDTAGSPYCIGTCSGFEDMLIESAGPQVIVGTIILMMAPSASNILDELLGTTGSKASAAASDPIKKAASGAPLIGGFFK